MSFSQYPRVLVHAAKQAAVWKTADRKGPGAFMEPETVMISPERFPDVTVNTLEQEKRYASLGYRPANCGNAAEYEQTLLESLPPNGYEFQAYPKWKYHATEMARMVNDASEEAALGEGWGDSPIIATVDDLAGIAVRVASIPVPAEITPLSNDERAELERLRQRMLAETEPVDTSPKIDKRSKAYRQTQAAA